VVMRIKRLRNRLRRLETELAALKKCDHENARRLLDVVSYVEAVCLEDPDRDELIDLVEDRLDELIKPAHPLAEWATDVGIDVAAWVAVTIWEGRADRLERRVIKLRRRLAKLERGAE
jgi:hypothetical protein